MRAPKALRDHKQWVVWKYITRDGKATKCPFQPNGSHASSTDPETWHSYEDCLLAVDRYEGLGFVFTREDPFIGIDLDGCRDPISGELDQWAKDTISHFATTYIEVSPSGTGVKAFAETSLTWQTGNKTDAKAPNLHGKKPGIEVYQRSRFFCFTGEQWGTASEVASCDDGVNWLQKAFIRKLGERVAVAGVTKSTPILERARAYVAKMPVAVSGSSGHNATFKVACVLVMGFGLSDDEAYTLMAEYNQTCQPPWFERELWHKIRQAGKQPGSRGYLAESEPSEWSKVRIPSTYKETEASLSETESASSDLRVTTLKQAAESYLEELRSGREQLIELGIPDLDHAIGGGVAKGEMIIFAARPSHGKSAVALQIIHNVSKNGIPCLFVSEEMASLAIGKRTLQYVTPVREEQWGVKVDEVFKDVGDHFVPRAEAYVIESTGTSEKCQQVIEEYIAKHKIGLAVIDYAQLLQSKGFTTYDKSSNTSKLLRKLASSTGIAIIVLAQLSRKIEERKSFVPMPSDIKETGQFEQDADVIIAQVWPYKLDINKDKSQYEFYVLKNRNRAINAVMVECDFDPARQMIKHRSVRSMPNYAAEFDNQGTYAKY